MPSLLVWAIVANVFCKVDALSAVNMARRDMNLSRVSAVLQIHGSKSHPTAYRNSETAFQSIEKEAQESQRGRSMKKSTARRGLLQRAKRVIPQEFLSEEPTAREMFAGGIVYVLGGAIVAYGYRSFVVNTDCHEEPSFLLTQREKNGFEFGLFSPQKCKPELAICSVFFLCIRWPSTVSNDKLGIISFWPAFFIFACLEGFSGVFFGLLFLVQMVLCVYFRQKIRSRYKLPHGNFATYAEDCLSWTFCCCCAGAQEAKQLDKVHTP